MGGTQDLDTKWRDLGVPVIVNLAMVTLGICGLWWTLLLNFGLLFGALTTYHYFLPKPKDYKWWHFSMHGFFIGLSTFICVWVGSLWLGFIIRTILLSTLMGIWYFIAKKNDFWHEFGRGFFIIATLPILLA